MRVCAGGERSLDWCPLVSPITAVCWRYRISYHAGVSHQPLTPPPCQLILLKASPTLQHSYHLQTWNMLAYAIKFCAKDQNVCHLPSNLLHGRILQDCVESALTYAICNGCCSLDVSTLTELTPVKIPHRGCVTGVCCPNHCVEAPMRLC